MKLLKLLFFHQFSRWFQFFWSYSFFTTETSWAFLSTLVLPVLNLIMFFYWLLSSSNKMYIFLNFFIHLNFTKPSIKIQNLISFLQCNIIPYEFGKCSTQTIILTNDFKSELNHYLLVITKVLIKCWGFYYQTICI